MSKKRKIRKTENCLNCGQKLSDDINFCPICGQRNQDNYVKISQLLNDFFSNYFSLDSRFSHSIYPFFFKPGFLTQKFIEGKRVYYANPIRLYLVVSLLHFFILSFTTDTQNSNNNIFKITGIDSTYDIQNDSLQIALAIKDAELDSSFGIPFSSINRLKTTTELSNKNIYDTLQIDRGNFLDRLISRQTIKISGEKGSNLTRYLLGNLPIIIFVLLPVFALLLKLFWYRKGLYIKHLIHSLHLHSFALMILTFFWLLVIMGLSSDRIGWCLVIIGIYLIISCYRLYQQGVFKILFKLLFIALFYAIFSVVILLTGTIISLLLY